MDKLIALLIILISLTMLGLWGLRTLFSELANGTGRDGQLITRPPLVRRLDLLMILLVVTLLVAVVIYIVRGAG
jgi:succinate dehydrogenase/fumarate reductase cytochrome b subunit